jgi:hypothetical protein
MLRGDHKINHPIIEPHLTISTIVKMQPIADQQLPPTGIMRSLSTNTIYTFAAVSSLINGSTRPPIIKASIIVYTVAIIKEHGYR